MADPSSSSSSFLYDVFLSFRGTDTRFGFSGYLYKALSDKGIFTFIDDEELQKGGKITTSLLKAIQQSRIAIVVLSTNYASSSFCLEELSNITDFIKRKDRLVLPVFYKVDPSDVRHQKGSYGEALNNHEVKFRANKETFNDNMERLQKWRAALQQVANFSGFHLEHGDEYEHKFIENIVKEVSKNIKRVPLPVAQHPVGLESRVEEVLKLLMDPRSSDGVHMVGIHGIGGVGKTTLALGVYNSVAEDFEGLCFLQNVRENSNTHGGLQHLQEILLGKMLGEEKDKLASVPEGSSEIQCRLREKKVLLILDDVDKLEQLQALAGSPDWLGPGSRVIITTRDKQLLACHEVEKTYEVEELNGKDALKLLRWKAFKTHEVDQRFNNILYRALTFAAGLPLALEVIGSSLFGKSVDEWKSALDRYERIPIKEIQKKLEVSFDALEEEEKSVFLDIACCFKGYPLAKLLDILHAHYGDCMKYHIGVLVEKSLVKIHEYGRVTLHDLIEDMGKEIVRRESPNNPGERSRLWFHEDIIDVLQEDMGTNKIRIIHLNSPLSDKEQVEWSGKAFVRMKNLKTLIINAGRFSKGPEHLPNSLKILEWWRYPSQYLPSDFHPKKLVICKIMDCCFNSPELLKKCVNMRVLNFDLCGSLTHIPDVSGLPNLEELSLRRCENLTTIHDSVGLLDKLRILNCLCCIKLRALPPMKLTSLEDLNLFGCSSLESFPEILGKMKHIEVLDLTNTNIKELPSSIENLTGLLQLDMLGCPIVDLPSSVVNMRELAVIMGMYLKLGSLPEVDSMVSSNLQRLELNWCNVSDEFLAIGLTWFGNVKELNLPCNNFTIIPECIKECRLLTKLNLDHCKHLREIRGIPPKLERFSARDCSSLTSESKSKLLDQKLHEAANTLFLLPGRTVGIPEWFEHRSRGLSISFWFRNNFPPIAICLLVDILVCNAPVVIINGNKVFEAPFLLLLPNHTYLFGLHQENINLDEVTLKNEWNRVKVTCGSIRKRDDKGEIGIHVFKEKNSTEDILFINPYPESNSEDGNSDSEESVDTRGRILVTFSLNDSDREESLVQRKRRKTHG
ncbi:disease resistance protein Roq1-like isoform X1 [Gastrolobium bilobum]|uniref:disease resistance protein Roq1-like isoform X1 n=1 Tax=Gastrolobium bilobum TaxID=150636 RepID=UPI002AB127D5|nr:disease resistance protein Roq1-like isoform X1 [Gastrolobium bilobum]